MICFTSSCQAFIEIQKFKEKKILHYNTNLFDNNDDEDTILCHKRRKILIQSSSTSLLLPFGTSAREEEVQDLSNCYETTTARGSKSIFKDEAFLSSLQYEKKLGNGSYKKVYLVSTTTDDDNYRQQSSTTTSARRRLNFALSVERIRLKSKARDSERGIKIAQELEKYRFNKQQNGGQHMFEQVLTWWSQKVSPNEFVPGQPVLQSNISSKEQRIPSQFLGTLWVLAIKPVYEIDLKRFAQAQPTLCPVTTETADHRGSKKDTIISKKKEELVVLGGIPLNTQGAIQLVRDLCQIMCCMQNIGLVHRDVKPKNVMLCQGSPVMIDFGFSNFVRQSQSNNGEYCIVEPGGRVVGELDYVLADDIAKSQGCTDGDRYAMSKTLYETIFGPAPPKNNMKENSVLVSSVIKEQGLAKIDAEERNNVFWNQISTKAAFSQSRFHLTSTARDIIAEVIITLGLPKTTAMQKNNNRMLYAEINQKLEEWMIQK